MKKLIPTSFDNLKPHMDIVESGIKIACASRPERFSVDDVMERIKDGRYQIWLAFNEDHIDGFIITTIGDYPQARALRFICFSRIGVRGWSRFMEVMSEWTPYISQVEKWGVDSGCSISEIEGPEDWLKFVGPYGYKTTHAILERRLV